ncbi:MAG: hypothetical protein H0V17_33935 [Deltaproteobacteria bacterium]|nr:hypothetical protein [Deltaproteobacteria bacterium]
MIGAVEAGPRVSFGTIDLLLRDREMMVAKIKSGNVVEILKTMTLTIAVAMAIVGAALGSYRGGEQILYAAIKLPLVLLGTAALSAPALTAIGAALGRKSRLASDLALVMSALAFGALLVVAFTPLIMLGRAMEVSYHEMILGTVAVFAVGGIAALSMVIRALAVEQGKGWRTALCGLCLVFVMVGGQLSWALRPYLVRPRTPEIVFVRDVEGSLFDAVIGALRSARGIYDRDEAPVPGLTPAFDFDLRGPVSSSDEVAP